MKHLIPMMIIASSCLCCLEGGTQMDPEKVLTLRVAQSGITRISVEADKIVDTFVDPQDGASALKNNRGHLYVSGQKNIAHMYLSLITKTGQVQDIKMIFQKIPPQPILLQKPCEKQEDKEFSHDEQYIKWLQGFLQDKIPPCFVPQALDPTTLPRQSSGFVGEPLSVWRNPEGYKIIHYRLRIDPDKTPISQDIKAEMFRDRQDLALVCSSRQFSKDKDIHLYVLQAASNLVHKKG